VEVARGSVDPDLESADATQPVRERGNARGEPRVVEDDEGVRGELFAVLPDMLDQHLASALLLALDEDDDVDRQIAGPLEPALERQDLGERRPLVVRPAAGPDHAVDDGGLEGWRLPEVERIDRLDVVVAVEEHGRAAAGAASLRPHQRVTVSLHEPGLEAGATQPLGHELRRATDVARVLGPRRHAGDPQELVQIGAEPLRVLFRVPQRLGSIHARLLVAGRPG
jgi:hypothetical protein